MKFNAQDYICKFYFMKYDHTGACEYRQRVSANVCLNELKIEIIDLNDKVLDTFGYHLDNKLNTLLPLIKWDLFEKNRDKSGWDLPNNCGYRDGWGYEILCMNESGKPLIRNYIDVTFNEKNKPAYEKLLDWIIREYKGKKELKKYKLLWWYFYKLDLWIAWGLFLVI